MSIYFLTVDLASKFSAACLTNEAGQVVWQGDSMGKSASEWVDTLTSVADRISQSFELLILVEDVPYGISSQAMTKPVLRLQGMLIHAMSGIPFYFINPSTWQKRFDGVGRAPKGMSKTDGAKYRIAKAAEWAKEYGYEPPNLVQKWQDENPDLKPLKKYTAPLEKNMTDYVDAYLMNIWLQEHREDFTTLTGVQAPMI